jgi:hypothetical protein
MPKHKGWKPMDPIQAAEAERKGTEEEVTLSAEAKRMKTSRQPTESIRRLKLSN